MAENHRVNRLALYVAIPWYATDIRGAPTVCCAQCCSRKRQDSMAEKQVPERFDWLSNVGAYVKAYGRVRLYALVLAAIGETWESTELYEVRVSDGSDRWYPVPAIPIEQSGVHDVLAHLHRFSSAEAAIVAGIRATMNEDRRNATTYYATLERHSERYGAVEAAIVELEDDLFAAD
jgi:hypothetical protein